MLKGKAGKFIFGNLMAVGMIAAVILLAGHYSAHAQGQPGNVPPQKDTTKIGTYDKQQAFQNHPAKEKLNNARRQAQTDMQKAQKEGNQQKMQAAQQQYQKKQEKMLQEFEQDISEEVPEIAKESGLDAVAREVVYTAKEVKTKDITSQLVKSFNEEKEEKAKTNKRGKRKKMPAFPE